MRRWIGFACGAAVLCGAAWYFGRPTKAPESPAPIVAQAPPAESPNPAPPKMIEVIDLARAYEPVREPEPVLPGGVDPASFIEEPSAPRRIPPATTEDNLNANANWSVDEKHPAPLWTVKEAPDGSWYAYPPDRERIEITPRVVPEPSLFGIEYGPLQNLLHTPEIPHPVQFNTDSAEINASLARTRELYGYAGVMPEQVSGIRVEPGTVRLGKFPQEVIALWLQIAELYGFVGVGG